MMSNAQLNRIPSIELQLFKWISLVDTAGIPDCVELKRAGTRIWIKSARQPLAGLGDAVPVVTLSNIQLNVGQRGAAGQAMAMLSATYGLTGAIKVDSGSEFDRRKAALL